MSSYTLTATSPQQTLQIERTNQDPRIMAAAQLYEQYHEGIFLLHKTTRAGCTTAMVAESINREEQFCCLVPTNSIADTTIVDDAKQYSDAPVRNIIHIPSNQACIKNQELIEEYPVLDKLPILPLADKCDECEHYALCPVTEVLRDPQANGFVLTYPKLVALMMAARQGRYQESRAQQILDTIDSAKNVVLDEVHELQYGRSSTMTIYRDKEANKHVDFDRYLDVMNDFDHLGKILLTFRRMLRSEEIQVSRREVFDAAQDKDFWKHHLRISHENKWKDAEMDGSKFSMACYHEIIEVAMKKNEYNLTIPDIQALYQMLNLCIGEKVSVHAINEKGKVRVKLTTQDWFYTGMIASYMMSIENNPNKIWLTSATICSYDYSQLFMNRKPEPILFGGNGDPMQSNSKMLIIADKKKYHHRGKNSTFNRMNEILERT